MVLGANADSASERTARDFADRLDRPGLPAHVPAAVGGRQAPLRPRAPSARPTCARARPPRRPRSRSARPTGEVDGAVRLPVELRTRVFGPYRGVVALPVRDERVEWTPNLAFPGLQPGEQLTRTSRPPERAALRSRDGKVLATGPGESRGSPLGTLAGSIAGQLSPEETAGEREALYARGFPRDQPVGQTGLEHVFEQRLQGYPRRRAARRRARRRPSAAAPRRAGADHDRHSSAGGGRDRAGGPLRRHRRARRPHGRGARARRASPSRPRSRRARRSRS